MIPIVATEPDFVREALIKHGTIPYQFIRFGMLESELLDLISAMGNPASSDSRLLGGLLTARTLTGVKASDMNKQLNPNLTTLRPEYIELSLMCGKHFVHWPQIPDNDLAEFIKFGITTHHADSIRYDKINGQSKSNVMDAWTLNDGGTTKLTDHALKHLSFIASVKIYDRYFSRLSLDALAQLFSSYQGAFGTYKGTINIYIGEKLGKGVTKSDIENELGAYMDPTKLSILKCTKCSTSSSHVHDRWMQLDNELTLEFSAGLSCYYENNGCNRASSVYLKSVVIDYTEIELVDENGSSVKFRV